MEQQDFEMKMKHLDYIQGVITRMNSNSFSIKGWMITIVAAFLAVFAASQDLNEFYLLVAIIPTLLFWLLDSYYLQMEKKYRHLFNDVKEDIKAGFDLDANCYEVSYCGVMFSKTEWPLYLILILILLAGGILGLKGIY